ncbi:hypothetical protein N9U93_01400 [Candidatus Pelagibacter sp.]|nr:hypothetical protein [Candidatus Pelagibacter sp.]
MKKLLIFLVLLSSCSTVKEEKKISSKNLVFSDDLTLDEFIIKLDEYANNAPYPNIEK